MLPRVRIQLSQIRRICIFNHLTRLCLLGACLTFLSVSSTVNWELVQVRELLGESNNEMFFCKRFGSCKVFVQGTVLFRPPKLDLQPLPQFEGVRLSAFLG